MAARLSSAHFGQEPFCIWAASLVSHSQTPSPMVSSTLRLTHGSSLFTNRALLSPMDCEEGSSRLTV